MARLIYILDTNIVSDLLRSNPIVLSHLRASRPHVVCLCQPVYFETVRGLIYRSANVQLKMLEEDLRPTLEWIALTDNDWSQAARLWADTVKRGRQLSDVDLLIAAIATRLDAIIVSSDADFDALPVKHENWRTAPPSES